MYRIHFLVWILMALGSTLPAQDTKPWKRSRLPKLLQLSSVKYTSCCKVTQWDLAFSSTQPVTAQVVAINLADPTDILVAGDSFPDGTHHRIWLNGLVPDSRYLIRISLKYNQKKWNWHQDTLQTAPLPERVKPVSNPGGNDIRTYVAGFNRYVAVHDIAGSGAVQVLDSRGRVRWYHDFGVPVGSFCITRRNTLAVITNPDEIMEVDVRGKTVLHINGRQKGNEWRIHHDLYDDTDTSFLAIAFYSRMFDGLDSLGHYLPSEMIHGDGLVRIGKSGRILWSWNCFEHADPFDSPEILKTLSDWNHANSIFIDTDGNFLISYKHLDQVWKINRTTGAIMWSVGKGGTIPMPDSMAFLRQHTINRDSDGRYYVFDNGREPERNISGVRWFTLNASANGISETGHLYLPPALFSSRKGSAFPVGNGCYLVCSSDPMKILLVREDGTILVTWDLPFIPLRANLVHGSFLPGLQQ